MREGLDLLAVERDVSVVASDFIATLSMQMYEAGRDEELADRHATLRISLKDAAARLGSNPPSDGWRQIHGEMTVAVANALATFDIDRTNNGTYSWLTEFLFDFKRVVPTDNLGTWSALLETATWAQEVPLVVQDYLDVAMALEWQLTGREPADTGLLDSYNSSLTSMRQLRESHGVEADEYTPFEEYILPDRARSADQTVADLVESLSSHAGVLQIELEMPYLLSLTEEHQFESISEVYELRELWVPELALMVEEIRGHAVREIETAIVASAERRNVAKWGGVLAMLLGIFYAVRLVRNRVHLDTQLRNALEQDVLTGLANRYALFSKATVRLADSSLTNFALIHVDLDDFKSINDDFGHHVGDDALIAFASALQGAVRSKTDLVCRVGGDEFVVVLQNLKDPESAAQRVIDRLKLTLETPIELDGASIRLHFTAGVSVAREPARLEELLVEADLALLRAKERGRDVAQFFRRKLGRRMIHELSTSLGNGELRCAFQPQVDLLTGEVIGLEALARWEREDRLQVPTRSLIDALEWLGASREWLQVGMNDIEQAWKSVGSQFSGRIWLNLMGCDIEDADPAELIEIFTGTEVPVDRIGLEITEAVGRSKIEHVVEVLDVLRDAGFAIALDDVGDDRVPLLHVAELPIDLVKLDRCLVTGIDSQPPLRAVVQSLSEMCERLDLRILAEGVETVEEETVLRRLGLRYVQGFLFARPLPLPKLEAYVSTPFSERVRDSVA